MAALRPAQSPPPVSIPTRILFMHPSDEGSILSQRQPSEGLLSRWFSHSADSYIVACRRGEPDRDRKSTRLNSSHLGISYAVFCLKKKKNRSIHKPRS